MSAHSTTLCSWKVSSFARLSKAGPEMEEKGLLLLVLVLGVPLLPLLLLLGMPSLLLRTSPSSLLQELLLLAPRGALPHCERTLLWTVASPLGRAWVCIWTEQSCVPCTRGR